MCFSSCVRDLCRLPSVKLLAVIPVTDTVVLIHTETVSLHPTAFMFISLLAYISLYCILRLLISNLQYV